MEQQSIEADLSVSARTPAGGERPQHLPMAIQSGILKSLGINLYTNLGKVIVEFIANAYDADAGRVEVSIPHDRIVAERARAKAEADAALAAAEAAAVGQGSLLETDNDPAPNNRPLNLEALFETLPSDVQVVIEDDGHGMTWEEVRDRFLPLNRQRRANSKGQETVLTSPGGRFVMGRKGVGKLAGFGAALTVEVWTKRKGDTSATIITLADEELNHGGSIHDVRVPVSYEDGLDPDKQGTRVTLSRLKADATRDTMDRIRKVVTKSFHAIRPEDFSIEINGEQLAFEVPEYEFIFPTDLTREAIAAGARQEASVVVPGAGTLRYRYYVGFLPRSHAGGEDRGATIYCNNRLAAGPALFGLPPGMHSFHSSDYMDCIIEADDLDRTDIDFVNTARNGIKEGNEVVSALLDGVKRAMKGAIAAHARFKKQEAGKKLLQTLASRFEVGTPEFEELAPTIVNSINATEVLVALASHGTDAATMAQIMGQLRQLSEIEKQDSIKLYRARRGGIEKLEILYEKGQDNWNKKQFEKELHQLLKENPWLIRPEFSTYISSDQSINTTVSRLAKHLKVDKFAPIVDGEELSDVRPDLVALLSDPMEDGPYTIKIIELKSPALPLTVEHWRQLENYIADVQSWCEAHLPAHTVRINGYLIGAMPKPNPSKREERMLLENYAKSGPTGPIQVVGLLELIQLARTVHVEAIKALERDLAGEEDDANAAIEDEAIDPDGEEWLEDVRL